MLDTQKEAIAIGRDITKQVKSELSIHGVNGQIRAEDSYGNDPRVPKDTVI